MTPHTANKVILASLKRAGIKYIEMNMREAARAVAQHFGLAIDFGERWKPRFAERILEVRGCQRPDPEVVKPRPAKIPNRPKKDNSFKGFYDSWEWKRLSYDTKLARGRKCECCGATAPGVRITTDHIKPIRHHWELRLDPSNLQVLCDDCNKGKGSRDQTDFRIAS